MKHLYRFRNKFRHKYLKVSGRLRHIFNNKHKYIKRPFCRHKSLFYTNDDFTVFWCELCGKRISEAKLDKILVKRFGDLMK